MEATTKKLKNTENDLKKAADEKTGMNEEIENLKK